MAEKKVKVAYVVHGLGFEGISYFTCNLMSGINTDKFDITVIMAVDDNGIPQAREHEILGYGIKILRTCDLQSVKRIREHLKLLKQHLIKTGPYDVIHVNMDTLSGLNLKVAKQMGIQNRICHSHKSKGRKIENPVKRVGVAAYRNTMKRYIAKYATTMIGCSDLANEYMYGKHPSQVVLNGIDTKKFLNTPINVNAYKKSLGIPEHKKVIATVARIVAIKNPFFTIEVVKKLSEMRQDFVFLWVGIGTHENSVKEKIKEYGLEKYFIFTGVRNDVAEILHCCEAFLLPSFFEGLPISVVEAQCAGCTCLVSDTVTRQIDGGKGKCAFLPITGDDVALWSDKLNTIVSDNNKVLLSAEDVQKFDIQTMIQQIEACYLLKG